MPDTGYLQVRAYSSFAQLPLRDVAITVTAEDGTAIAMATTDQSGKIQPIEIPVPDRAASQSPGNPGRPFTSVTVHARLKGYVQIQAENIQIFSGTITLQNLEMIPLSELPGAWDQAEDFNTPPQNL